ncbi:MAG: ATP-binding protein [Deltaproteobacteria bacterium]
MRYLNKIIFINSASIKYSEIGIDGNVHFIGTQGVGKSTILRALLFFYNANQLKLGVPVGKKSFVDFYLPYQNSYVIYEVVKGSGPFCVLIFKSQGRVSFRFFDAPYDKRYFIENDGRAFESWDKTRSAFGNNTNYTKKIDSYKEYLDILYGNNHGIAPEFRKYAILESKQYQNIPRTIQNVFLNSKLEAEFIKDTIIKSMNEDEIKIDLSNYSHHLKDFETQLRDINKWTEKNKSGEVVVRKQAETVVTTYSAIKHLEREIEQLAGQLIWALDNIEKVQPEVREKLEIEDSKKNKLTDKLSEMSESFDKKKEKIQGQISVFKNKIDEAKKKAEEYEKIHIDGIIQRVAKKTDWENEKQNLMDEEKLLSAKFQEINQKNDVLIRQLQNQLERFENGKQTEKLAVKEGFQNFKEDLVRQYEQFFEEIKRQHHEELQLAINLVEGKRAAIHLLQIKKEGTRHHRFYEDELKRLEGEIGNASEVIRTSDSEIKQSGEQIKIIQKQWELEGTRYKDIFERQLEKRNEENSKLSKEIASINEKIEDSKDSLYGWLNDQYPSWENTIGKVIDEENVLFRQGLSPEKVVKAGLSFYGVSLDLNEINKKVKTVSDYENDRAELSRKIEDIQKNITELSGQLSDDLDRLKRKHQPKINELRDTIRNIEYTWDLSKRKLDEALVKLNNYKNKAISEKESVLKEIELEIQKISNEKLTAEDALAEVEKGIKRQIELKKKEKEKKIEAEQQITSEAVARVDLGIEDKKKDSQKRTSEIKEQQQKELSAKGADVARIKEIENRIGAIDDELSFIEKNRHIVAEYNKDKRELFDRLDEFKNEKHLREQQLENESSKYKLEKQKLSDEIGLLDAEIALIKKDLDAFDEDLKEFERFKLTECHKRIEELSIAHSENNKTDKCGKLLIEELNSSFYKSKDRYTELQEAIHKFNGNFSPQNIFKFKTNLIEKSEYLQFAEDLKEFIDEDKISDFEKRVNERFAQIIKLIGKETTELMSREGEIQKIIADINKDFVVRNFAGVIKSIELRVVESIPFLVEN